MSGRIYSADSLEKISKFYKGLQELQKELEGDVGGFPTEKNPIYIYSTEIVLRHRDDYTIGRIGMDDYMFFEFTEETYGEIPLVKE